MPERVALISADLRMEYPEKPVLVLSAHAEENYAKKLIKMRACGVFK